MLSGITFRVWLSKTEALANHRLSDGQQTPGRVGEEGGAAPSWERDELNAQHGLCLLMVPGQEISTPVSH